MILLSQPFEFWIIDMCHHFQLALECFDMLVQKGRLRKLSNYNSAWFWAVRTLQVFYKP
jgi:hypothetical protein